jgi:heat shock protein HslJ
MQKVRLIVLAAILAATSCASDRPRSDQWPTGRTFLSTSVTENGQDRPLVDSGHISLRFTAGSISARAGCNILDTDGRVDDHRLILGQVSMTDMACDQQRMAQDEWLSKFLSERPAWSLSGEELVLSSPTVRIRLLDRRMADPDRPLAGTRWVVVSIISHQAVSSMPSGVEAYLQLDTSGGFRGSTGCAPVAGSAAVHADRITFSTTGDPSPACTGPAAMLASAVLGVVRGEVSYRIEARRLTLTDANSEGLELRAD